MLEKSHSSTCNIIHITINNSFKKLNLSTVLNYICLMLVIFTKVSYVYYNTYSYKYN